MTSVVESMQKIYLLQKHGKLGNLLVHIHCYVRLENCKSSNFVANYLIGFYSIQICSTQNIEYV